MNALPERAGPGEHRQVPRRRWLIVPGLAPARKLIA
jgi:hypothetical protein